MKSRYQPYPEVRIELFRRGLTVTEVARRLGRGLPYVSGAIATSNPMSVPLARDLSDLLGIEVLPERREAKT